MPAEGFLGTSSELKYIPGISVVKKDVEQLHIIISFPSVKRGHPKKYALSILNTILGGGLSSRMFQRIREQEGLSYSVYTSVVSYSPAGLFTINASLSPGQCERVCELMFEELAGIITKPVSEKELVSVREQLISNIIMSGESTFSRMSSMGGSLLLLDRIEDTEMAIKGLHSVTCDEVTKLAKELFDMEKIGFSAAGATGDMDFAQMVEKGRKKFIRLTKK